MPYIVKKQRERLSWWLQTDENMPHNPGELNFVLTKIIVRFLDSNFAHNYTGYNAVMGVLTCIQHELYRRMISVYEDKKKEENGDVFNE